MLSTSVIKNVAQASHYFSSDDNYYTKEEGQAASEWQGNGASRLGLFGEVDPEKFTALLQGYLPTGEQLGKVENGQISHRPGWDLTFSAPKSVSVMALIGGDKRLIEAHRGAVAATLAHIETSCSETRIKLAGNMHYENTHNIIAALYHHDLSREHDPQLHTHSVVMNITQRSDSKWRSMASQIGEYNKSAERTVHGFIERVRNNKRYYGKVYETELAYRVKAVGYDIHINDKTKVFEITGVSLEVTQFFSKRRSNIEEKMQERGVNSSKAAEIVTLNTRESKKMVDRESLLETWKKDAERLGFDSKKIMEVTYQREYQEKNKPVVSSDITETLQQSIKSLSVFKATFSLEELITHAFEHSLPGQSTVAALMQSVQDAIEKNELISIPTKQGKTFLMSQDTLEEEKNIGRYLKNSTPLPGVFSQKKINNFLYQHNEIPKKSTEALRGIFDDSRFVLLEGRYAKEQLIKPMVDIINKHSLLAAIISSNQITSKQLSISTKKMPVTLWEHIKFFVKETSIQHYDVMSYLSRDIKTDVLIVDNSHLLSTYQFSSLLEKTSMHSTKVIFLGENNTLLSQQRGLPLAELTKQGLNIITMKPEKNKNLTAIHEKNVSSVLDNIKNNLIEVKDAAIRQSTMVDQFAWLYSDRQLQSFLVSQNKRTVEQLNILAHDKLKEQSTLGKGINITLMTPVFLTEQSMKLASSYKNEHQVRFNTSYASLAISRGEYLRVIDHYKKTNTVVLKNTQGKIIHWQPDKIAGNTSNNIELFQEKMREILIGERLVFHRGLRSESIVKGEYGIVQSVDGTRLKVRNENGTSLTLDLSKPEHRHIDYGYAATPHGISHKTAAHLMVDFPANDFKTHERALFQTLSQSRITWVYTDNVDGFCKKISDYTGDKLSAQTIIEQSLAIKNNLHSLSDILEHYLKTQGRVTTPSKTASEAISYAIRHLSEREAGFTHNELMYTAMQYAIGNVTQDDLVNVTFLMEKAGILLRGNRNDGILWTTAEAVNVEREIMMLCQQDKGKLLPIASDSIIEKYSHAHGLNTEQRAAVTLLAQSNDRVMAVQGYPGTGKTTMLMTLADVISAKELFMTQGYELRGLAPTNTAVNELIARGIVSQTIDSFLLDMQREQRDTHPSSRSHQVLIIDESSMVSNHKMLAILKVIHELNFRGLISIGDTRQLPSIEAGKPQTLLQTQVSTAHLTDIRRQENTILQKAVKEVLDYEFDAAFSTLKESIIEIPPAKNSHPQDNRIERITALVNDYFSYSQEERKHVQIITPGHDDRKLTNALIRDKLIDIGELQNCEINTVVLSSKNLTKTERSHADNFSVGDILRFNQYQSVYIKKDDYVTVTHIDRNNQLLILKNKDQKEVIWQIPSTQDNAIAEVLRAEERGLRIGDCIRWTRSDKKNNIISNEVARVEDIQKNVVTVKLANQQTLTFNSGDRAFQHWDHGYASTVYAVQGNTVSVVLAHLESFRENLVTQPALLVALTRAVHTFRLYTDNASALLERVKNNAGIKISALEVIGQFPDKNGRNNAQLIARQLLKKDSLQSIKEKLNEQAEQISLDILGKPKFSNATYLKFGSRSGSLIVTTSGTKQGYWHDFSEGGGGRSMLSFIQKYGNLSLQEAIKYGGKYLSKDIRQKNNNDKILPKKSKDNMGIQKTEERQQHLKITFAKKLAEQSQPIAGTLAERYLIHRRGIMLDKYPDDIRFHSGLYSKLNGKEYPAMLVIARDSAGNIKAVQATYLDPATANKVDKTQVTIQKQTFGMLKGATVFIPGNPQSSTLIAEGVETGLSLAKSLPDANIKITLGKSNFLTVESEKSSGEIVFCLDNDGKDARQDPLIRNASERLHLQSKEMAFMIPQSIDSQKKDYNDVIRENGVAEIRRDYANRQSYRKFYATNADKIIANSHEKQRIKIISEKSISD